MSDVSLWSQREDGCVMQGDDFGRPIAIVPLPVCEAMVERAAKVSFEDRPTDKWDDASDDDKEWYRGYARDILTAALTPPDA